jgi:hypothetical protein
VTELCLPSTTLSRSDGGLRTSNSFWILIDATCRAAVYVNLGSVGASLTLEARRGSRSDVFKLTLFWVGTFWSKPEAKKSPQLPQPRDFFRSCPAFRDRDQARIAVGFGLLLPLHCWK